MSQPPTTSLWKWLRHQPLVTVPVADEDWWLRYLFMILTYISACAIETCIQMSQLTAYCIFQVKMLFGVFPPLPDSEFCSCFTVHHSDNNNVVGCCSYAALYPIKMVSYQIYALHSEIKEWASQQLLNANKNRMWKHLTHHGQMYACGKTRQKPQHFLFGWLVFLRCL